jgi:hypothetical protein
MDLTQDRQTAIGIDPLAATSLDSGGSDIPFMLWDTTTGEQLRQRTELPTNGFWTFSQSFATTQPPQNASLLLVHRALRTYRLVADDLVLVRVESA